MYKNRCYDMGEEPGLNTKDNMYNKNDNMNFSMEGCQETPIMECPQERCCHRQIHHEVKHVIPVNTRIINHHIIHHRYVPMYTCCEQEDFCNVYDNRCGM